MEGSSENANSCCSSLVGNLVSSVSYAPLEVSQPSTSNLVENFVEPISHASSDVAQPSTSYLVENFAENISSAPSEVLQDQQETSVDHSTKRKRRERCVIDAIQKVSFELFEPQNGGEDFILKMHQIETGENKLFQLFLNNKNERLVAKVKKLSPHPQNIVPKDEVGATPVQSKFNFTLQERLGGWTVQKRKRNTTNTYDKYYMHEKVNSCFRSLNEVAVFIVYNCRKEDIVGKNVKIRQAIEHEIKGDPPGELERLKEDEQEIFSFVLNNPLTEL